MEVRIQQDEPILDAFAPIIGLPAWGVMKGQGSMLTLEFGQPRLVIREPITAQASASPEIRARLARRRVRPVGAWHLWFYSCNFRLLVHGYQTAWSEESDAVLDAAAREIDGQKLLSVAVNQPQGTSSFEFDLGARLETWPSSDADNDEQWMLYTPEARVLSFYADGHHTWEEADQDGSDKR
jgi:hypothetical protein